MNQIDLQGKRAIITGGARGMGYAIAKRFLESGASVALWDINQTRLTQAEAELQVFGEVIAQVVDVSDYTSVAAAANQTAKQWDGLDILVNSAGIAGATAPVIAYPLDTWQQVQRINVDGIFHTCRAIVPTMQQNNYGRIVNIASIAGKEGNPNASGYSVSKAAVIALTKSLGKELADTGIRVNAVAPAVIRTEMLEDITEEHIDYMVSKIPMGRTGTLDEIAAMVSWLCSEECSYCTGAVFDLSGGRATY